MHMKKHENRTLHHEVHSSLKTNAEIKNTLRFHLTPVTIVIVGEDVGEKVHSYIAGGTADWCNHFGKQYGDS